MIRFAVERWPEFVKDAAAIFPQHWAELSVSQANYGHAMDDERYHKLDEMGLLHIVTVRDCASGGSQSKGKLIGYAVNFLQTHMHYKTAGLMSLTDMYYLLPERRRGGLGAKMFAFMEARLRERGVVQMHTSCKLHMNHTELLEKMGWKLTDLTFMKWLGAK